MTVTIERNGKTAQLKMPCSEITMTKAMEKCNVYDITDTVFHVTDIEGCYPEIRRLIGGDYDLDHLNLLARVADSLCCGEDDQFQAGVVIQDIHDLTGMINAMIDLKRYSIAKPETSLRQIGEDHYMDLHGSYSVGSISDEEFEKIGADLLKSGGIDTPYGKAFVNDIPESDFFDGKHLPGFYDKPEFMFGIFLEANGSQEFLMLPEPNSAITKAMKRLGVKDANECTIHFDLINSENDTLWRYLNRCTVTDIFDLNRLAAAFILMSGETMNGYFRALDFIEHRMSIDSFETMADIAQHISDFVFGPGCDDEYDYGHYLIEDSGRYEYDENLADYYDYAGLGADIARAEHGLFICGDYVGISADSDLIETLGFDDQEMGWAD